MVEKQQFTEGGEKLSLDEVAERVRGVSERLFVIDLFRPDQESAQEQKRAFLAGEVDEVRHEYSVLEGMDFEGLRREIGDLEVGLEGMEVASKFVRPYRSSVRELQSRLDMVEAANNYRQSGGLEEARRFMEKNIELYGEPNRGTYEGLMGDLRKDALAKSFTGEAEKIRRELLEVLPEVEGEREVFKPSDEAVGYANTLVNVLYEPFFEVIPEEQETFSSEDVAEVFHEILHNGMGGAADDWQVEISEKAKAMAVSPVRRVVTVPAGKEYDREKLEELVVHEIGVHVMRSVMGESNIEVLSTGLSNYEEAEEGLAVGLEQALRGEYTDRGVPYYLMAGMKYFDNKTFRETFEVMWRRGVVESLQDGEDVSSELVKKEQELAYDRCLRIVRGTDDLPWFKDLTYYNGNVKFWSHIEKNNGNFNAVIAMFLGKIDYTNSEHIAAGMDAMPVN